MLHFKNHGHIREGLSLDLVVGGYPAGLNYPGKRLNWVSAYAGTMLTAAPRLPKEQPYPSVVWRIGSRQVIE